MMSETKITFEQLPAYIKRLKKGVTESRGQAANWKFALLLKRARGRLHYERQYRSHPNFGKTKCLE